VYTVAGTSGSVGGGTYDHPIMITSLARLGSLVIDIDGDELCATFIDTTGAGLDSFVVSKADIPTTVRHPVAPSIDLAIRPNPFADDAQLNYLVPSDRRVTLEVFNVRGQHVRTLLDRDQERGAHIATWDGRDQKGTRVAQGVYFAVLRIGSEKRTARLVLIR
jgi:hypothetical protein